MPDKQELLDVAEWISESMRELQDEFYNFEETESFWTAIIFWLRHDLSFDSLIDAVAQLLRG